MKKIFGNNFAFTLAEVLITLGIIGVVAAMTIPILMASYQEKQYLTQFKETYSMLSQAYIMSAQDNGTAQLWTSAQDAYDNMKPYLKISKDCGYVAKCWGADDGSVKTLDGTAKAGGMWYHLILANGATLWFADWGVSAWTSTLSDSGVNYALIFLDINGVKPPNQFGYDYFLVSLTTKKETPVISGFPVWWAGENTCKKSDTSGGWYRGGSCSYWVLKHGNMDYLHRDIDASEWWNN